ncbi:MAG: hydroxyethylthiazole kinase [Armatimonadetes bacterium]|nr:hydroxyethylthiazole kinase [Armatimonadota bacterium]
MDLAPRIGERLAALRAASPLIHCLTNLVTIGDVADAVLAIGALPVMTQAGEEIEEITSSARAVMLNLGTPSRERVDAMWKAGKVAGQRGIPVILDPVGAGASAFRTQTARRMLAELPIAVVRANAGEAAALLGVDSALRGVESIGAALPAEVLAHDLASRAATVVAVTGPRDHLSDGRRSVIVEGGHPLLARITGGGDLATAMVAAFASVEPDALAAGAAGLAALGVAAEIAAERAAGPGSFRAGLMDALAGLAPEDLSRRAKVHVLGNAWT